MPARAVLGVTLIVVTALGIVITACGSGDSEAAQGPPACTISISELGPYSPETPLGETMSRDEALARVAADGVEGFIAIHASGPWDLGWEIAERQLGSGIHSDLAWLDVAGDLHGVYEDGDGFGFSALRVSRSYQGKIEAESDPLYVGIDPDSPEPKADATCEVTSVTIGTSAADAQLDLLPYIEAAESDAA